MLRIGMAGSAATIARLVAEDRDPVGRQIDPDRQLSKLLSYVLRHHPDAAGVVLDAQGWVAIDALLAGLGARGTVLTRDVLDRIVAGDRKRRYAVSDDGLRLRASQGHSVEVELGYEPAEPPPVLYHGTAERNLDSIRATGLDRRERHHVHLSAAIETARQVGGRHGRPVVLVVDAAAMRAAGVVFYLAANGVWLVERVDPIYLRSEPRSRR
jgi:putative RNA 2'-phosphotransferase